MYDRPGGVNLSAIPSIMCEEEIRCEFSDLRTSCLRGLLFTSLSWKVEHQGLDDVRLDGNIKGLEEGKYKLDHNPAYLETSPILGSGDLAKVSVWDPKLITRTRYARSLRARACGEFLKTGRPSHFSSMWERCPDRLRGCFDPHHLADFDANQSSRNTDLWPQHAGSRVLAHREYAHVEELDWRKDVGMLMGTMVSTDVFPLKSRVCFFELWFSADRHRSGAPNQWPVLLQVGDFCPPDYSCRAVGSAMGWSDNLTPVLFAAHCEGGNPQEALEILAATFHQTMILFILYYLDTRSTWDEDMPGWMVLYGITYSSEMQGFRIHAYHPIFESPEDPNAPHSSASWGAVSTNLVTGFKGVWRQDPWCREPLLATLSRIQGHCMDVLSRLRAWSGYSKLWKQFLV
ncbi:hypothetical protein PIIN_10055 [Serendipita indica DSM 11827]|uniref:Uncharacterized protein n=1 Tax=Serendipita indica (strain DSM 11827) TaxID=1109443 RepID=G4TXL2_SERID|nr:hypothetical protein PIIN_10055 [Serendipita indica DSM 11827]